VSTPDHDNQQSASRRIPTKGILLLVAIVLAATSSVYFLAVRNRSQTPVPSAATPTSNTNAPVQWAVKDSTLPAPLEAVLSRSVSNSGALRRTIPQGEILRIYMVSVSGDYGAITGGLRRADTDTTLPTEPVTALLYRTTSGWSVIVPDDPSFCGVLSRVPDPVMTASEKDYFRACR